MNYSVLMSIYNGENCLYFSDSLKSLCSSKIPIPEIILVQDGFIREELTSVIATYADKLPIRLVQLDNNLGLAQALNYGINFCTYDIVARFDTDDKIHPERFLAQVNYISTNPNLFALGTCVDEFDQFSGNIIGRRNVPLKNSDIVNFAKFRNPINHPSVIFRKSIFLKLGGYPDLKYFEDYGLWVKAIQNKYRLENLKFPFVQMRTGIDQIRRRNGFDYVICEYRASLFFKKINFFSYIDQFLFLFIRVPPRFLNVFILKFFYRLILRS